MIRETFYYLLARGIPGLISVAALSLFTRLLSPQDYGSYALVIAAMGLGSGTLFLWLNQALIRFYPSAAGDRPALLATLRNAYGSITLVVLLPGLLLVPFVPAPYYWLALLGAALICAQGGYDLNLALANIRLEPHRYGRLALTRAVAFLVLGWLFIRLGLGAEGALLGMLVALLLAMFVASRGMWGEASGLGLERERLARYARYGIPLSMAYLLNLVIDLSDRFMIASFLDRSAVGYYAPGYELGQQLLGVVFATIALAGQPRLLHSFETRSRDAAGATFAGYYRLLLTVTIPLVVIIEVAADEICQILIGPDYRASAAQIMRWVAPAILLGGIKAYYFDMAFQLAKRTDQLVWITLAGALANVLLNLWLIPGYGILGAAWATLASYALSCLLSVLFGGRLLRLPRWPANAWIIVIASLVAAFTWSAMGKPEGILPTLTQGGVFVLAYGAVLWGISAGAGQKW